MTNPMNRWIAALGTAFTANKRKERADRFVAWLAGASRHERSMNG